MHTLVFFANLLIANNILGQLLTFQALSQCKTRTGVQQKKKPMPCWRACNVLTIIFEVQNVLSNATINCLNHFHQRHEDSKTGQMGNVASGVWHLICPHKRKGQHPCRFYLQALHNKHLQNSRWYKHLTHSKHSAKWNDRTDSSCPDITITMTKSTWVPTHIAHYKNKINFANTKFAKYN